MQEIAEATVETSKDVQQHIKDHPDFKEIGNAMIDAWG